MPCEWDACSYCMSMCFVSAQCRVLTGPVRGAALATEQLSQHIAYDYKDSHLASLLVQVMLRPARRRWPPAARGSQTLGRERRPPATPRRWA